MKSADHSQSKSANEFKTFTSNTSVNNNSTTRNFAPSIRNQGQSSSSTIPNKSSFDNGPSYQPNVRTNNTFPNQTSSNIRPSHPQQRNNPPWERSVEQSRQGGFMGRINPTAGDRNGGEESRDNRRKPLFSSSGTGGSKYTGAWHACEVPGLFCIYSSQGICQTKKLVHIFIM